MQNSLITYAHAIKTAAMQLEAETKENKEPAKDDKLSQELQAYATFLRKFLTTKGNDEILSKITPLIDNPRVRKPRNTILMALEKGDQKRPIQDVAQLIIDIRRILVRYGASMDKFPSVRLLKEILNFGVVNGVPAFKRLLGVQRRLYNTFNTQEENKNDKAQESQPANEERHASNAADEKTYPTGEGKGYNVTIDNADYAKEMTKGKSKFNRLSMEEIEDLIGYNSYGVKWENKTLSSDKKTIVAKGSFNGDKIKIEVERADKKPFEQYELSWIKLKN